MAVYYVDNLGNRIEFPNEEARRNWAANNGITLGSLSEADRDRLIEMNSGPTFNVLGFRPLNGIEGMRRPTFTTHSTVPDLPLNTFGMRGRGVNAYQGTLGSNRFDNAFYSTSDYDALLGDVRRELVDRNYGINNPFRLGNDVVGNTIINLASLAGAPALGRARNINNLLFGMGLLGTGTYAYNLLNTNSTAYPGDIDLSRPYRIESADSTAITAPVDSTLAPVLSAPVPERDPDEEDDKEDSNKPKEKPKNSENKPLKPNKNSRSFVPLRGYKSHPVWSTIRDLNYADIIGAISADVKLASETGEPFLPKTIKNGTLPGLAWLLITGIPGFMLKMAYGDPEKLKSTADSIPSVNILLVDTVPKTIKTEKVEELRKPLDVDTTSMATFSNPLLINL